MEGLSTLGQCKGERPQGVGAGGLSLGKGVAACSYYEALITNQHSPIKDMREQDSLMKIKKETMNYPWVSVQL